MIHIIADTTSCIPVEEANQKGLGYIPQIIVFGDETYRDDTEMNSKLFLQRLRASSTLPKTAAPPPALYTPIFQNIAEQGDTAIVICPSSELSGTYRSANVAAQDFPGADIRILDTRLIAGGLGAVALKALEWASEGLDVDTIVANIQEMAKRNSVYFVVDTLEYLYKGGRIGAARALFGSLLQVKPILFINDGLIAPSENSRTRKRSLSRLEEIILSQCPPGLESHLCVMHGDAEDEARQLISDLATSLNIPEDKIPLYDLPPAILVHAGPGVLGASFFTASKEGVS